MILSRIRYEYFVLLIVILFNHVSNSGAFLSDSSVAPLQQIKGRSMKRKFIIGSKQMQRHVDSAKKTLGKLVLRASLNNDNERSSLDSNGNNINDGCNQPSGKLNWNLPALLSHDPSTEPKIIHLMDIFNEAIESVKALGEKRSLRSLEYSGDLPQKVAPYRMFVRKYNHDMGHDGRFTVFGRTSNEIHHSNAPHSSQDWGSSLQSDVVFSMDDPLKFIREGLSYSGDIESAQRYKSKYEDEALVFAPGLNTFHEGMSGERTSVDRVKFYSQVLGGVPMAQIHAGTYLDQGDVNVRLTRDTIESLKSLDVLQVDNEKEESRSLEIVPPKKNYTLRARDLDVIRNVLSRAESSAFHVPGRMDETENLRKTMVKLIDAAVKSELTNKKQSSPHLVLMVYSATSNVLAAALVEWKHQVTASTRSAPPMFSEEEAEKLLRKALTVITVGNLCKGFIDGPAYIHLSMHDDLLASSLGVSKEAPEEGGKDAVYIHGFSPYALHSSYKQEDLCTIKNNDNTIYSNDSHNMDACAVQYLSLIRRINGLTSFRQLYDLANDESKALDIKPALLSINISYRTAIGQLEVPPHMDDELIPSMIRATGGHRFLWNSEYQLGQDGVDGYDSPLPSPDHAEAFITNQLGYSIYDEIVDACD